MKGTGNQQDYGLRIYDPRISRFLSVDPLTKKYPELTPYQFASNSPIENIDLDGAEKLSYMDRLPTNTVAEGIGNFLYNTIGAAYNGVASTWNTIVDVGANSKNGLGVGLMTTAQAGYENNIKPTVDYITKTPADQQLSDFKRDAQDPNTYFQAFEQGTVALAFWRIGNSSILNKTTATQNVASVTTKAASIGDGNVFTAKWAQLNHSNEFSKAGQKVLGVKTIDDAVDKLKSGTMSASNLPIDYIVREGQAYILNTRSSVALTKANIDRSKWNWIDRTGSAKYEQRLSNQLKENNGTDQVVNRQTGETTRTR
ncbi:MAG: hypothetical protein JNL51_18385 [Chitinophagaceae bacterium]|nr:hypothetical protein [Chitinophagaceae bacterium]